MAERSIFAQIIIPVPVAGTFTYEIPISMVERTRVGQSVIVQFGGKKLYTGIVASLSPTPPEGFNIKSVMEIVDERPTVTQKQLELWQWTSDYYMCPIGDVYKAAVPVGLRPDGQSKILPVREKEPFAGELGDNECAVFSALLRQESASVEQLAKTTGLKNILTVVKRLVDKGFALITEEVRGTLKPRRQKVVKLTERIADVDTLNRTVGILSPKQGAVLRWMADFLGTAAFVQPWLSRSSRRDSWPRTMRMHCRSMPVLPFTTKTCSTTSSRRLSTTFARCSRRTTRCCCTESQAAEKLKYTFI